MPSLEEIRKRYRKSETKRKKKIQKLVNVLDAILREKSSEFVVLEPESDGGWVEKKGNLDIYSYALELFTPAPAHATPGKVRLDANASALGLSVWPEKFVVVAGNGESRIAQRVGYVHDQGEVLWANYRSQGGQGFILHEDLEFRIYND